MYNRGFSSEFASEAIKGAPPITVAAAAIVGWGVTEWVAVLTGAYVLLQAAYLIWKWRREARDGED